MKKLINKIRRKKTEVEQASRITSETVADHREKILAGGRKFKYPLQYTRRRLVYIAIIIGAVAIAVAAFFGWWQLYVNQNTSDFMYRVTQVLPVPVAKVDGEFVQYHNYLIKYRGSVYYLENIEQANLKDNDGKSKIAYIKQQAMQDAIADAYAVKLAADMKLSVSQSEVEDFIVRHRQTVDGQISEQSTNSVIMDNFGWSPDELRHEVKNTLLRQKVSYAIDVDAKKTAESIASTLKSDSNTDFKALANNVGASVTFGSSGWVPKENQDGGLALAAIKLQVKEISGIIKSSIGDGYYIVKLININNTQVNYEYIKVPLTVFDLRLKQVEKSGKVDEYISIPKS